MMSPQEVLDRQGYLVLGSTYPLTVGEVIREYWIRDAAGGFVPGMVVIVGQSTSAEWIEQCRMRGFEDPASHPTARDLFFYRATAE
jgi:hypothetical protein